MASVIQVDEHVTRDARRQKKTIKSLRDWSKWLISVNFFAAAGCVIILERGASLLVQPLLVGAIVLFVLSIITSALVMGVLAVLVERLPLRDTTGATYSMYDHLVTRGISLGLLVKLQFALLVLGFLFFLAWVLVKPVSI
jgi:predicted DNA repair protein MutK